MNNSSSISSQAQRRHWTDCEGCFGGGNRQVTDSWLKEEFRHLCWRRCLPAAHQTSSVQQQKLHSVPPVSNTWHPSGRPVHHTCLTCPVPIWLVFTTTLLTSCSMSGAFLLWTLGPYLEPFLPTKELIVHFFNNTTIWASGANHQVISGKCCNISKDI